MSRSSGGGLTATVIGGITGALLCALLAALAGGLPTGVVESLQNATPELLHPFVGEMANGFLHDLNNDDMPTAAFLVIQFALWLVMFLTGWRLLRRPDTPVVLVAILGFSVLFRLLLLQATPIHGTEFYRYLWDGGSMARGVNPYVFEPAAVTLREHGIDKPTVIEGKLYAGRPFSGSEAEWLAVLTGLRDEEPPWHERITDPHLPTPHPPAAIGLFAITRALFGESVLALKLITTFFDLGIIVLLLRMLRRLGLRRAGVIFYAWSPLVLTSFANSAHYESIPIFFLLCAISMAMRLRVFRGAIAIAIAGLMQLSALIFTPILFRPSWRNLVTYLLIALLAASALLFFGLWDNAGIPRVLSDLRNYQSSFPSMAGLHLLIAQCAQAIHPQGDSRVTAQIIAGVLFTGFLVWQSFRPASDHRTILRQCFWIAGAWFLLSAQASPSQLLWVVPFLCAFPRPSWLLLTFTIQTVFLRLHTDYPLPGPFWNLPGLNVIVWILFLALWLLDPALLRLIDRPESPPDAELTS